MTDARDHDLWWSALYHGGLLIAPSKLVEFFPASCPPLDDFAATRLRGQLARVAADPEHLGGLLDTVLENILGLDAAHWQKGSAVAPEWSVKLVTGETERPRRIWAPPHKGRLPVFVCTEPVNLGVGRSRRTVARVLAWLRAAHQPIAFLTNGRQWRLLHAALDHESWCEWDTSLWFQEGAAGPQLTALRILLARDALRPGDDGELLLLAAIQATRQGQGELSAQLGERVRQAVELLIQASSGVLGGHDPRSIYIAATRLVMRCVVLLFAEARGGTDRPLLPRDNQIYRASYSIQGLREQLDRAAGGRAAERLRHGHSAWPRLMSLFRLVYHGSQHERLLIPRYGGGLFFPCHDPERTQPLKDPIDRALEALEHPANAPNDAIVYAILDLLTRSRVRVRQGRRSTWVMAPVDFSDLSSEYIGILYEGLLDFELRQAPEGDAMVFLNLGSQPVLPFARLDAMTEKEMVALVGKLRAAAKSDESAEEDADDEADDAAAEDEAEFPLEDNPQVAPDEPNDQRRLFGEKVQIWAEKAVKAAEIVKCRKSSDPRAREAFEIEARAAAKALISKIVYPDEWYLVRWGGTRKGSGTFYTRPQLAGPTTRRALQPLLYMRVSEGDQIREVIRRPEQILALKVCDPAMGSGSFVIAALRVLVDALYDSLHEHGRLVDRPKETIARLADGLPLEHPSQETIPVPHDAPDFEDRLRARLKRHVVERCLYGVELDPLAVELARMAVWLETMDYQLPFEFLDHKLRCGNSLVGAWIDRVLDFPALCFERAAGDEDHDGVHVEKGARARALKQYRNDRLKPELRRTILARTRRELVEVSKIPDLVATHTQALAALREIHDLPIGDVDAHEQRYRSLQGTHDVVRLRAALDRWCALWFWPSGQIDAALDPGTFLDLDTPAPVIDHLRNRLRFFHWELEFPDVFTAADAGFDAIVGNPPWETQKPNSMEFFSNIDPLYRTYDKQQALRRQRELFKSDSRIERDWLDYVGQFAAISNWFLNVAWPFGDGKFTGKGETFNLMDKPGQWRDSDKLHGDWRDLRKDRPTFADPEHPYQHQGGSDINSYKLFLEQTYRLLRPDGRLALLVPSGIYTDKATGDLRKLFLEKSRWTHLYALQNERFVFGEIDHRFKVAIVVVSKGGQTDAIETRFRIGPGDSPEAHEVEEDLLADNRFLPLQPATIREFSPNSGALLEIRDRRDLAILEKMYAGGVLLGDQSEGGWQIQYATEFHMTNDSKLFPPRAKWEAEGYRPSEYSFWLKGIWADNRGSKPDLGQLRSADGLAVIACDDVDGVALPFYQGVMVQPFDFAPRSWVSGTGLRAVWREIPWDRKNVGPQFLMELSVALSRARMSRTFKPGMRRVARSTDTRTSIASLIPCMPCGDKVSILDPNGDERRSAELVAFLGTFSFDWVTRLRSGGTQIDQHSLYELALPAPGNELLSSLCVRLNGTSALFARLWLALFPGTVWPWRRLWAVTPHERLRLRCILDAVVAHLYGLAADDFAWILRDCDHPVENVCNAMYARRFDPKGFWRVDKDHLPELRHPVLAQIAFHDLQARGLDAFLAQNDGEGWMLPETLRLADYDLGHDERARVAQPVAAALGPRFLPWQLEQSVDESWDECRRHAELIARIVPPPPPREPAQPAALSTEPVEATVAPSTPSLWPEGVYANIEPIQGRLIPDPAPEPGQRELFHLGPKPKRPRKK